MAFTLYGSGVWGLLMICSGRGVEADVEAGVGGPVKTVLDDVTWEWPSEKAGTMYGESLLRYEHRISEAPQLAHIG